MTVDSGRAPEFVFDDGLIRKLPVNDRSGRKRKGTGTKLVSRDRAGLQSRIL